MARRSFALLCVLSLAVLAPLAPTTAAPPTDAPHMAADMERAFGLQPIPLDTRGMSLRQAVSAWDAKLGVVRAPGALDVLDALHPQLAAPVAHLLSALLAATELRDEAYAGISDAELFAVIDSHGPAAQAIAAKVDYLKMRGAAIGLAAAVDEALPALQAYRASLPAPVAQTALALPTINLPPVLEIDPLMTATFFEDDAVLIVDLGGNDLFDNNAGGSMIASGPIDTDPSTCQFNIVVAIGCDMNDANLAFTAALSIDLGGDDVYGSFAPPKPGGRDSRCTTQPIPKRILDQGAGSGGIGFLVEAAGNDLYIGKTVTAGNGHVGGVGVVFELTGNDIWEVIREGTGSADLVGATFFEDTLGDDVYEHYSPVGGIFNADSGRCDATKRFGEGASIIAGFAYFLEAAGNDVYRVNSQAFGSVDGTSTATFIDAGGVDDYGGFPGRDNGQTVTGAGTFVDV
jgi:hypothetical protein